MTIYMNILGYSESKTVLSSQKGDGKIIWIHVINLCLTENNV